MRHLLGLCLMLAPLCVGLAASSACHEEFSAPDQPDLAKIRKSFDFDLSGVAIDDRDLSVNGPFDLAKPDLTNVDPADGG